MLVIKNCLRNHNGSNYAELVSNMVSSFNDLGCNMSIKDPIFNSHLDHFLKDLDDLSKEQSERFHQDTRAMVEQY